MWRSVIVFLLVVVLVVAAAIFLLPSLGFDGNQCGERWKCGG